MQQIVELALTRSFDQQQGKEGKTVFRLVEWDAARRLRLELEMFL